MQQIQDAVENEVNIIKNSRHLHVVCMTSTYIHEREFAIIMTPVADANLEEYLHRTDQTPLGNSGRQLRKRMEPWFSCLISGIRMFF